MVSIRTRILFFFALFAAGSFFAVTMSTRATKDIVETAHNVVSRHLPMVHALGKMEVAIQRQDNAVYRYVTTGDAQWKDEADTQRLQYARWYTEAQKWASEDIEKDKLKALDDIYVEYDNQTRHILLSSHRPTPKMRKMLTQGDQFLVQIQDMIGDIIHFRHGISTERKNQILRTIERNRWVPIYFLITIAVFIFLLTLYLWRFLFIPLKLLIDGIRNFTRGESDVQIPPIGKDELGELQEAFNEMSRELNVERRRLRSESQSDALTGLFNMRYFKRQLVEEFSRSQRYGRPLALVMVDVDHFKSYNDRNGHPAGDIVLKEVSRILIRSVRGTDIVARYGGEEFVVLLPETPLEAAGHVAEKIRKAVEAHHFPFRENMAGKRITVSLGLASYPDTQVTSDQELVEAADRGLYSAKQNGRNQTRAYLKGKAVPTSKIHQMKLVTGAKK